MLDAVTEPIVDLVDRNVQLFQMAYQIVSWGNCIYAAFTAWGVGRGLRLATCYAFSPVACLIWAGTIGAILEAKREEKRLAEEARVRNLTAMIRSEARQAILDEFSLNKVPTWKSDSPPIQNEKK